MQADDQGHGSNVSDQAGTTLLVVSDSEDDDNAERVESVPTHFTLELAAAYVAPCTLRSCSLFAKAL